MYIIRIMKISCIFSFEKLSVNLYGHLLSITYVQAGVGDDNKL